jgi:hypothetical protein
MRFIHASRVPILLPPTQRSDWGALTIANQESNSIPRLRKRLDIRPVEIIAFKKQGSAGDFRQ